MTMICFPSLMHLPTTRYDEHGNPKPEMEDEISQYINCEATQRDTTMHALMTDTEPDPRTLAEMSEPRTAAFGE